MSQPSKILTFGSTGTIGPFVTSAILAAAPRHGWTVSIFTSPATMQRKAQILADFKTQGAKLIAGDLQSADDVNAAYEGIDTVVSCVGRGAIDMQVQLVRLADNHKNVRRFYPSEFGADVEYGPESKDEKPHQAKLKVRAALRAAKGLEHTFMVVGPYADGHPGFPLGATPKGLDESTTFDVANKRAIVLGDGDGKVSYTSKRDVGRFTAAALAHPDASRNKALRVNSFTASPNELVAEFERQTGSTWTVSQTSIARVKELEAQASQAGSPAAFIFCLRRIWAEGGSLYAQRDNGLIEMEGDDNDTLESAVRLAIETQIEEGECGK